MSLDRFNCIMAFTFLTWFLPGYLFFLPPLVGSPLMSDFDQEFLVHPHMPPFLPLRDVLLLSLKEIILENIPAFLGSQSLKVSSHGTLPKRLKEAKLSSSEVKGFNLAEHPPPLP